MREGRSSGACRGGLVVRGGVKCLDDVGIGLSVFDLLPGAATRAVFGNVHCSLGVLRGDLKLRWRTGCPDNKGFAPCARQLFEDFNLPFQSFKEPYTQSSGGGS